MVIVWAIVGAIVGGLIGQGYEGAAAGFAIGLVWGRLGGLSRDLDNVRRQIAELRTAAPTIVVPAEAPPVAWPQAPVPSPQAQAVPPPVVVPPVVDVPRPVAPPIPVFSHPAQPPVPPPMPPPMPREPAGPSVIERAFGSIKRWFTEGNVPVKIGMLVLFAGIAASLKYASDQGLFVLPVSVRLAAIALAAIGGVAFAWRHRETRRSFSLSLQGGSIGVLLMTIFSAYHLYGMIPPLAAFVLLVVMVAGIGVLAVLQDAVALAVLGLIAGFATPILVSTGSGNHVALFSYYAVLNVAILGIAWKRAWRILNVLGFIATFGVGTAWGVLKYDSSLFASTEPFLILNFLFYLAIPWLHVLRSPQRNRAVLDGCLMFGNPLVSLLLQGALLDWQGTPLALSALAVAAIYVAIAWVIRSRDDMAALRDTWAVLAVAFATLAVPLALSATVTASVFALEGAGLIWLGFRQGRRLPLWSGVGLQLFAALSWAFWTAFHGHASTPVLNAAYVGVVLLVLAGATSAWLFDRHGRTWFARAVSVLMYAWALLWWLSGTLYEINWFTFSALHEIPLVFVLFAVTAWMAAEFARCITQPLARGVVDWSVSALIAASIVAVGTTFTALVQPFAGWWLMAIVVAVITGWRTLRLRPATAFVAVANHVLWWWRWVALAVVGIALAFYRSYWLHEGWQFVLPALPVVALMVASSVWPRRLALPLSAIEPLTRSLLLLSSGFVVAICALYALFIQGSAGPLPFMPLLNPIELFLMGALLLLARAMGDADAPPPVRAARPAVLWAAMFAFVTSATLRAVAQMGGAPWGDAIFSSHLAQLSLTVVWSVIGVVAWVVGSKRGQRALWTAGAVTMAVVLAKLLLVDRAQLGNLFGIASFIAYGLLCTVIGYFAPAPPRPAANLDPESPHAS
ncbi:putative membrane protein [Luteibacter sp. Sphag1AF]|uniref:DUF2339 domain-containing protein n=1 Tax=Luteibacter sp. Sphag1AF TaxID=2587031 RepID=UPI00160D47A6|nr:DUF2339 domain-containing protein [Luteibacter sp. Sphag1AF]MBB3228789.1 putative membrane protein [Luteibacter sp. Sphag1AF]